MDHSKPTTDVPTAQDSASASSLSEHNPKLEPTSTMDSGLYGADSSLQSGSQEEESASSSIGASLSFDSGIVGPASTQQHPKISVSERTPLHSNSSRPKRIPLNDRKTPPDPIPMRNLDTVADNEEDDDDSLEFTPEGDFFVATTSGGDRPPPLPPNDATPQTSHIQNARKSVSFQRATSQSSLYDDSQSTTSSLLSLVEALETKTKMLGSRRMSLTSDFETGKVGGVRGQTTMIRKPSEKFAQSSGARRRKGMQELKNKLVNKFWGYKKDDDDHDESYDEESQSQHSYHRGVMEETTVSLTGERMSVSKVQNARRHSVISEAPSVDSKLSESSSSPKKKKRVPKTQYRLEAVRTGYNPSKFIQLARSLGVSSGVGAFDEVPTGAGDNLSCFGFSPNLQVIRYLNWAFRSSFSSVFLSVAFAFFSLTLFFAVLFHASGVRKPECLHVNGVDYGQNTTNFADAYALSWTTFSTVGYGLVYPATSGTTPDIRKCTGITVLATLESFVGILFASLCGAIVFAKVSRVASFAQVSFSDPIVIRYGTGCMLLDDDDDASDENMGVSMNLSTSGMLDVNLSKLPCPLLEFRVVNRLHDQIRGEIIDATMNVVASVDESQGGNHLRRGTQGARRRAGKKGKGKKMRRKISPKKKNMLRESDKFERPTKHKYEHVKKSLAGMFSKSKEQAFEEDPTGKVVPKKIFAKLEIESPEHPFFKRLWLARHVLDHHSPLLRQEARELVRLNGGHWPEELNSAEAVRASIHFDQLLVSLSGTSNVDANSVYAQKVYDFVDVCVGYSLANILFRDKRDNSLAVDLDLINDVKEQYGGGGEDLTNIDSNRRDIYIL